MHLPKHSCTHSQLTAAANPAPPPSRIIMTRSKVNQEYKNSGVVLSMCLYRRFFWLRWLCSPVLGRSVLSLRHSLVSVSHGGISCVEQNTRDQADSEHWMIERRLRITASRVGSISKMRKTTRRSKKVQELLYSTFRGNQATLYGSSKDEETKLQYITQQRRNGHPDLTVSKCGFIVCLTNPWLGASPDGAVQDPNGADDLLGLVEIKNPFSARQKTLREACASSTFCLEEKENVKLRHDYYHQVQCQLYCANRNWCDFVLRTNKEMHVERIYRDKKWWGQQLAKLRKFYFTDLLPELASPRHREPQ